MQKNKKYENQGNMTLIKFHTCPIAELRDIETTEFPSKRIKKHILKNDQRSRRQFK
jgi:hypothetical protein